jgi:hypothetical protein
MSPHRKREVTRARASLAVLAALLVAACSGGGSAGPGSDGAHAPSSGGPPGAPPGDDAGDSKAPSDPSAPPSETGPPPGDGTKAPPQEDTSGWARDSNGNLIGPTGW